jgi:hypothetical protein
MLELNYAEVSWNLNAYCKFQCAYCPSEFKNGELDKSLDQYLTVVQKLQDSRYKHHSKIYWKIGGGEPLHFPHLSVLLKKMREQSCIIQLDTSGDDTWFSLYGVLGLLDKVNLTYHSWQNDDIVELILEQCQEKNVSIFINVPLLPGLITESREKVQYFKNLGHVCNEQILYDNGGELHHGYSTIDANRIFGRPDDWEPEPVVHDPNMPAPGYVDLSIINNVDPVYTGMPCYAGVDWIYINSKGFASYSQCGGRNEHFNVFDPAWQAPDNHFTCTVNQCRHDTDRKRIRIVGS